MHYGEQNTERGSGLATHTPPPGFPLLGGGGSNWSKATPTVSHQTTSMLGMLEHILHGTHSTHTCTYMYAHAHDIYTCTLYALKYLLYYVQ